MKQFKNELAVIGPISLLKAFAEELDKLGHIRDVGTFGNFDEKEKKAILIYNEHQGKYSYGVYNHYEVDYQKLYLPQDWDKALKLAAEVEEQIPEYVEILITKGIFKKGDILKTQKYPGVGWRFVWPDNSGQMYNDYYKDYYKPSTKEAYEAQFQLKPEVGKWYKLENPNKDLFYVTSVSEKGVCFGYGIVDGDWMSSLVDDDYNCICNEVAFKTRAKLATNEEVHAVLTAEAKKRYPIGSRVDQKTAYNGYGEIFTINNHNTTLTFPTHHDKNYNLVISDYGVFNTKHGIWAEIVKEVKVNGYVVTKINNTTLKVGCKVSTLESLIKLRDFLDSHGGHYYYDEKKWSGKDIQKVIDEFLKM